jgi:hypothetical protein
MGVLATIGVCFPLAQVFPSQYSVTATVLLLPPKAAQNAEETNPLLLLGGLMAPADVLISALGDPSIETRLENDGLRGTYAVTRDYSTSAPVLLVSVEDPSLAQARATRDQLLGLVRANLAELQSSVNVAPRDQITSKVISAEGVVTVSHRSTQRALLTAVVAGLALTLGLAALVEARAQIRARRRAGFDDEPDLEDEFSLREPGLPAPTADRSESDRQAEPLRK